ncbi:peptidoglycan-binding protein LysM [Parvularcula sp. IMCC14364]|uniref:peptidoglycan-binding protein LysM n=1 Tax=Parvularcula sp. IMCC14364 TaxID=3067902 RepID=UPI002741320A|nr:peptidoglycan-binding protein LysM [Parvularcula sp. IMCC14364]
MFFKFPKAAGDALRNVGGNIADAIKDKFSKDDKVKELDVEEINVEEKAEGKVVISGKAKTQADAEKAIIAAGNNAGVEEVESRIEVAEAAPEAKMYEVKSGDTLSKIAREFYGDAMKYPAIFEANKPLLSDPDKIYPGQVLRIPPLD